MEGGSSTDLIVTSGYWRPPAGAPTRTRDNLEPQVLHLSPTQPSYPALPQELSEDPPAGAVGHLPSMPIPDLLVDAEGMHKLAFLENFQEEFPDITLHIHHQSSVETSNPSCLPGLSSRGDSLTS